MRLEEAVTALQEGRCKAIESPATKNLYSLIITSMDGAIRIERAIRDDWQLVDPIPAEETVEVVRWFCTVCKRSWDYAPSMACCKESKYIKLTGTYKRLIPQKVKRREKISAMDYASISGVEIPHHAELYAEWEE